MTTRYPIRETGIFRRPLTPPDDVVATVKTVGYDAALAGPAAQPIIERAEDSLRIGIDTRYSRAWRLRRLPNGAIVCSPGQNLRLRQGENVTYNDYLTAYADAFKEITDCILRVTLRTSGQLNAYAEQERDYIRDELESTAAAARATMSIGYARSPARVMQKALSEFLDRETMRAALSLGGITANIATYNTVVRHRRLLERAAAISPNAVTVWLATAGHPLADIERGLTAEGIVGTIRDNFGSHFRQLDGLSVRYVRENHPDSPRFQSLMRTTGSLPVSPTYTVSLAIGRELVPNNADQRLILAELTRLSRIRLRQRGRTQSELVEQAKAIFEMTEKDVEGRLNIDCYGFRINNRARVSTDPEPDWDGLAEDAIKARAALAPKSTPVSALHTQRLGRIRRVRRQPARLGTRAEFRSALDGPTLRRIRAAAATDPVEVADDLIVVRCPTGDELARYERLSNGVIRAEPAYLEYLPADPRPPAGLTARALGAAASAEIERRWRDDDSHPPKLGPSVVQTLAWLDIVLDALGPDRPDLRAADRKVDEELGRMLCPVALAEAREAYGPSATLWQYNATAANITEERIRALGEANPLASAWLRDDPGAARHVENAGHPGQLITAVRSRMTDMGFDLRYYRRLNRLDRAVIERLLQVPRVPMELVMTMLHVAAEAGCAPSPLLTGSFLSNISRSGVDEAHLRATELLMRESARQERERPGADQQTLVSSAHDVFDYVYNRAMRDRELTARTWGGLAKRSRRWHAEQNMATYSQALWDVIHRHDGCLRRWRSLIERSDAGEYELVALESDLELFHESLAMSHCSSTYGNMCADGRSRIYRIYLRGQHVGTGEIALTMPEDKWTAVQTRGPHNHPMGQEAEAAMDKLADRYTAAWRALGVRKHEAVTLERYDPQVHGQLPEPSGLPPAGHDLPW